MLSPEIAGAGSTALEALASLRIKLNIYYETAFLGKSRSYLERENALIDIIRSDESNGLYEE